MGFYYYDQTGFHEGTPEQFFDFTGAHWTDTIQGTSLDEAGRYGRCSAADRQLSRLLLPQYRAFLKKAPKLYLQLGESQGRHSVCAGERIAKGSVVLEYLGEWDPLSPTGSSYRWGPIDAIRTRNFGAMAEDGFPNVAAFYLYNVDEIPVRILFVALEEIAPNETITIHYGMNHSVKVQYHTEYRYEAMKQFFSSRPLEKMVQRIKELRCREPGELGWKKTVELESLVTKLRYLYETPGAAFCLIAEGLIDPDTFFHLYGQADFRYFLLYFPFEPNKRQREVLSYIEKIREAVSHGKLPDPALLGAIRHRLFFSSYLPDILAGNEPGGAKEEALLWNRALDSVQAQDKSSLTFHLSLAKKKDPLTQACLLYAEEIASPLAAWLQTLDPINLNSLPAE